MAGQTENVNMIVDRPCLFNLNQKESFFFTILQEWETLSILKVGDLG